QGMNPNDKGATNKDASRSIEMYRQEAQGLSQLPPDPRHPAEIKALRSLADALSALPCATDDLRQQADGIRKDADTLEASSVKEVHSDTTKDALSKAVDVLSSIQAQNKMPGLDERLATAKTNVDKIDASVPFLKERENIDQAFVNIGDALS